MPRRPRPPKPRRGSRRNPHVVTTLPKAPVEGDHYQREVSPKKGKDGRGKNLGKRKVTFKATGEEGFGKYRITDNEAA